MVSVSPTSLLQQLVPPSEWVGVSDVDLERWSDYMEANGVVFVISIVGVNVVQKLVSHFGHLIVEVIILIIIFYWSGYQTFVFQGEGDPSSVFGGQLLQHRVWIVHMSHPITC